MFGYYGTGASVGSVGVVPRSAEDISDEEIAYQLQLEALAESSHHYSVPSFQPSSSSQSASSSSGSRVVRRFGARHPRQYPDQGSVASRFLSDEVSTRRRHRLDASTPPLALNNALNAERDGALSSNGTSGADNALIFELPVCFPVLRRLILHFLEKVGRVCHSLCPLSRIDCTEPSKQRHWLDQVFGVAPSGNTGSSVGREHILEMECGICTETRPHTSFISTPGCNHEYCSACCKRHAEVKVSSGSSQIQCPHDGCRHNFDIVQCRELLSQPSFDILTTRQTEAAIPSSQKVYCPFQDCSAFMEKPANNPRASQFVECGTCHRGFCLKCNTPWHANKTCAEHRADVKNATQLGDEKLRDLVRKEKWQVCSECQRVISLKDGCYHMTCLCGNEFCYACGAKWKNKVASCKCKLWDESNIIRSCPGRRLQGRVNAAANGNGNGHPFVNANPFANAHPFVNANPFANGSLNGNPFANVLANPFANGSLNGNPFANVNLFANPSVNPFP